MVSMTVPLLRTLGNDRGKLRVGILAGGRRGDAGRSPEVDGYLEEGMETVALCRSMDLDARFLGIEVERALPESDVIVAPDGVTGNFIFRLLFHFAKVEFMGAIYLGLPHVVVDSSSSRRYFDGPVRLAAMLAGIEKV
jgi:predicted methyltransferase MtxX (methanogen marker protein 4)